MNNSTLPEIFSFKEVEDKYKNIIKGCKVDTDCPDDLRCVVNCELLFYCNEKNLDRCANNYISDKYFNTCKTNEDCLSNNCVNNICTGRLLFASVGDGQSKYGLEIGETCNTNNECYEKNCKEGKCEKYDFGRVYDKIAYSGIGIIVFLILLCCIGCFYIKKRNRGKK